MEQAEYDRKIANNGKANSGLWNDRLKFDPKDLENAFAKHWRKENKKDSGTNQGQGVLQNLFYAPVPPQAAMFRGRRLLKILNRDRLIAATVIQWLGSNCGFCWLREALKLAGWEIVQIKKQDS